MSATLTPTSHCPWCFRSECDCKERMECTRGGVVGHTYCGVKNCGCPKFLPFCEHAAKDHDRPPILRNCNEQVTATFYEYLHVTNDDTAAAILTLAQLVGGIVTLGDWLQNWMITHQ